MAELHNEFAFSWSRQKTFRDCARKFYWQYYGSWAGWADDAPRTTRIAYRLKQLKSLSMLVGETFHAELAEILRFRPPQPCGVPVEHLKQDMERRMLRRLRQSRNADWERYQDPKNYTILFEDYYGHGITGDMETQALETLRRCVDGLAGDSFGRRAFAVPAEKLRYIDPKDISLTKVRTPDGLTLFAKPDLIVAGKTGGLHILDWKTGMPRPHDVNAAQLAIYGIFVRQKFDTPLEHVTAHLIYVAAGQRREQNVIDGEPEARRVISTFVSDVKSRLTDPDANVAGDMDQFPMTTNRTLCRGCNYRELCGRMDETALAREAED